MGQHGNAPLTTEGRRRLCERIDAGRPISHVAAEAGVSRRCLSKWYGRWQEFGPDGLEDRSSRPANSPTATREGLVELVVKLRRDKKWGPARIAAALELDGIDIASATVHRILVRNGLSRLRDMDPPTGEQLRQVVRYEHIAGGDMIHVDIKKLGRIPEGGGWRIHGRGSEQARATRRGPKIGFTYVHAAIDDYSRLAYAEALDDEKGVTAAGFWLRSAAFFAEHGIVEIHRALTDNGSCYRSRVFAAALGETNTKHKRTRPYSPKTNGKVERFNATLAREWAYCQDFMSEAERRAALPTFLNYYNHDRPHHALKLKPPSSRTNGTLFRLGAETITYPMRKEEKQITIYDLLEPTS